MSRPSDGDGEDAELVALGIGQHVPADLVIAWAEERRTGLQEGVPPPQTSQWTRFFTRFGSGTGLNTIGHGSPVFGSGASHHQESAPSWWGHGGKPRCPPGRDHPGVRRVDDQLVDAIDGQRGGIASEHACAARGRILGASPVP